MRLLNRHFFAGVAVGMAFALAAGGLAGALAMLSFRRDAAERLAAVNDSTGASGLHVPSFPSGDPLFDLDWTLRDLEDRETSLADLEGKVLFLNVWATWCAPCVAEMPTIGSLMELVPPEDVAYLLVTDEPVEVVRPFVEEKAWDLPIYLSSSDAPQPLGTRSLPTTFIVDPKGRIAFRHVGAADWGDPAAVRFLTSLLDE